MIFDSHTHLDDVRFDQDRDEVVKRALEAGVTLMMNPGADLESSKRAVDLSIKYPSVYAAVGIHPHDAKSADDLTLELIKQLAKSPKVCAIGEIGLDFHYDFSPREVQRDVFIKQIHMAKALNLPIIIHDREANQEIFDTLCLHKAFETGVLMHCYSGSAELAKEYIKKGAKLSIAGPVTFDNAKKLRQVVETIGLEHLMIETDAPYLTPMPHRGKRNEAAYVTLVARQIAIIKGMTFEEVSETTYTNAKTFFRIK
jgi:TatD DNase family protein